MKVGIIGVPTPLTGSREPDLTYLVDSATALSQVLQPGVTREIEAENVIRL